MKKILGKVFSIVAVFLMVITMTTVNVFAETSSQDGLEVITITDKESYKEEDKATVVLSIKNTNGYDMKDVEVNVSLPKQLSSSEKTVFNIPLLKAKNICGEFSIVALIFLFTATFVDRNERTFPSRSLLPYRS